MSTTPTQRLTVPPYHARVMLGQGRAIYCVISSARAGRIVVQAEVSGRTEGVPLERIARVLPDVCSCIYCTADAAAAEVRS